MTIKLSKLIDIPDILSIFLPLILLEIFPIIIPLCTSPIPKAIEEFPKATEENMRYVGYHTNLQPSNVSQAKRGRFQSVRSTGRKQTAAQKTFIAFSSSYHGISRGRGRCSRLLPPLGLPLHPRNPHQHFFVFHRYPACKHFHCVFEIRL